MKTNRLNTRKNLILIAGICIAVVSILLTGCEDKVEITEKYTVMEPVYLTPGDLRASFDVMPPEEVTNTGKIYLYQNYILLNEPGKGIHVIDNKNKELPKIISFINIPGNYEMAVQYQLKAIELVRRDGQTKNIGEWEKPLKLYREQKPLREP